jgi:transposase
VVGPSGFTSYAPKLNPAEGIWNYLKRVELKNRCCQSISHLYYELGKAKERLRHKTNVISGCIKQPGFYLVVSSRISSCLLKK